MSDVPVEAFERRILDGGTTVLWARRGLSETLLAAGIRRPADLLRDRGTTAPGRGPIAILTLAGAGGGDAVLKRYRRGGLASRFLPDRFVGHAKFWREIEVGEAARRRGLPVPEALALVLQGGRGRYRVYGLTRLIPGAANLLDRIDFGSRPPLDPASIAAAATAVRSLHDTGLRHADLSLGNFLVSRSGGEVRAFLVDLAGARLGPALTHRQRRRSLRRVLRSWIKQCDMRGRRSGSEIDRFLSGYCAGDRVLRAALRRGGGWTRLIVGIHRLGWRLTGIARPDPVR